MGRLHPTSPMPNSRSAYNFAKDRKSAEGRWGSSRFQAASPHPGLPSPRRHNPRFCSPEQGSPLPGRPSWRRGGAEPAEGPRRNAAGRLCSIRAGAAAAAAEHPRRAGQTPPSPPLPEPFQRDSRWTEQPQQKCPFPTPIPTGCQQPRGTGLSGAGSSGGCGEEKQNATLSRSSEANDKQHSRPLLTLREPLIRSRRRRASWSLDLHGSLSLGFPHPGVAPAEAARRARGGQELGVGQGACSGGPVRSISGRCKISRNLRKLLECGAAIGPFGRGLGRAGEGRSQEVDGKYEGVVWWRGVVIRFPPSPARLFPSARKADHQCYFPYSPQPCKRTTPGRDLPREFHIGNGQVRRNAGGGVPGKTPWMGLRLCSPTIIRFGCHSPRATPPLPRGPLCRAHPASLRWAQRDADFGLSSAGENHLRLLYVVFLSGGGAENLSLFDLRRELKFSYDQIILKHGE